MEESKEDENIRYQNLGELSRYIFSITKIIEDLSKKPIRMKKEFDGFCKKETKNFDRLLNYFKSIENSPFPSNFWNDNKSNIKTTNKGSLRGIIKKIKQENNISKNTTLKKISDFSNVVNTPTIESLVLLALGNIVKNREIEHFKKAEEDYNVRMEKSGREQRMSSYFPEKERIATDSEKIAILKEIKEKSGIGKELDYEILENKIIPTEQSVKEFFEYRKTGVRNGWGSANSKGGYSMEITNTTKESYDLAFEKMILNFKYLHGMEIKTKTKQERLSWIFSVIVNTKKKNKLASNEPVYIEFNEIIIKPYFFLFTFEEDFNDLFSDIKKDKDFFRKHNMTSYNPDFEIDPLHKEDGIIKFSDFTDDFIKEYTEDRINIKQPTNNCSSDKSIQKIEILKDKSEEGRINVYINDKHESDPLNFKRGKNWQLMYEVAKREGFVAYDDKKGKAFYDYFNYNKNNPLYKKHGFEITKILKEEDGYIVPNIEIGLTTKNKTTRQLKSA